jgi:hypothetical protein
MIFGAMNKERRGFTRGRNCKVHPITPRAFRGPRTSITAERKGNGSSGDSGVTGRDEGTEGTEGNEEDSNDIRDNKQRKSLYVIGEGYSNIFETMDKRQKQISTHRCVNV